MSKMTICRQDQQLPDEPAMAAARELIFGALDGFTRDDKRAWRRFWKMVTEAEPGELFYVETVFPRSGKTHRRHMAIEQHVFDAQERFQDWEAFRYWVKVGSGWVTWAAGPAGGVVPIPKSISYAKADEEQFQQYHDKVIDFLRGEHCARYLWPHLSELGQAEMIEQILGGFNE